MAYAIEGKLLEACSCGGLCPCWVGDDPDTGSCYSMNAYHYDRGQINGVDVTGLTLAFVCIIPGNVLKGNWKVAVYMSDKAKPDQKRAILDAWTGKLGGPLADLAGLFGEVISVDRAPISHETRGGKGTLRIGEVVYGEMEPYRSPDGQTVTTLRDSLFSTVPGSPAYVAKADHQKIDIPEHGYSWEFSDRNAIQSDWKIDYRGE
jgi:hypothetical protein